MPNGIRLIADERNRQISEEGWDASHDDEHEQGELAMAAVCYAAPEQIYALRSVDTNYAFYDPWPWADDFDKRPLNKFGTRKYKRQQSRAERIRALVKAGALIAAEIDRIQRGGR